MNQISTINTIIEETNNFIITPTKGSLVVGYLLIIPKKHITSMNELDNMQKSELKELINKYRLLFYNIFGRYPIFFEHGTSINDINNSASSITHAHLHIVNHNFKNEKNILRDMFFNNVNETKFFENNQKSYISYISPNLDYYITYNYEAKSQQMRLYVAEDLNISDQYDWKSANFNENIINTIKLLKQ
ncbi:MAG: HIT domain-containing protein [Clostridia bacterium]|nr:HIT domain-containing protein [Clostridia bacterium]